MFCGKRAATLPNREDVFTDDIANPVFEISDKEAYILLTRAEIRQPRPAPYRLDAVLDHPALYANYPALAALPVYLCGPSDIAAEFMDPWHDAPSRAAYDKYLKTFNPDDLPSHGQVRIYGATSAADLKDRLIHEVQHAVQVADFTNKDDYYWFIGEAEHGKAQYRRAKIDPTASEEDRHAQRVLAFSRLDANLKMAKREMGLFWKSAPDEQTVEAAFNDLNTDEGGAFLYTHPQLPNRLVAVFHYADTLELFMTLMRHKQEKDPDPTLKNIETELILAHKEVDFYMPREMQARETQDRAALTEHERHALRPHCAASWPPSHWHSATADWAHLTTSPSLPFDHISQKPASTDRPRHALQHPPQHPPASINLQKKL